MATKKTPESEVAIRPIEIKTFTVRLTGDTPLIMHKWSEKARKQILDKDMKVTKTKAIDAKSPALEFVTSMYWITGEPDWSKCHSEEEIMEAYNKAIDSGKARFGFPCTAIKQATLSSAYRLGWIENQTALRGSFFVVGDKDDLCEIKYNVAPEAREDMVKIGMGTADIRYRGEFPSWYVDLKIQYNANGKYTLDQIINFINAGGFTCGIGEWRPERDGDFGRYHVEAMAI